MALQKLWRAWRFCLLRTPQPLPVGIESFIGAFWGKEEMFTGSKPPDAPDAFLRMLEDHFRATDAEEHVGLWEGDSALWFRGRIRSETLTSDDAQSLDGFVAAVKGETGEWNTFLIASYPANVYADAFSQTVSGFRPLVDSLPDNDNSLALTTGECSGSFSEVVSPPPYQPIKAFIVTFSRTPTVEVTDEVVCKPRPPEETECEFLEAVSGLIALTGGDRYRIDIWPTASAGAVNAVRRRLGGPHTLPATRLRNEIGDTRLPLTPRADLPLVWLNGARASPDHAYPLHGNLRKKPKGSIRMWGTRAPG